MIPLYVACFFQSLFQHSNKEKAVPPETYFCDQIRPKLTELILTIEDLYEDNSKEYLPGSCVTQKEHALQTAALARSQKPDAQELVASALLYDLDHLLHKTHDPECVYQTLKPVWGEAVIVPILQSSMSQRFLAAVDSGYMSHLSPLNQDLLLQHGGALTKDHPDYIAFRKHPYFEQSIILQHWHDAAKTSGKLTPSLQDFRSTLFHVAYQNLSHHYTPNEAQGAVDAIDEALQKIKELR